MAEKPKPTQPSEPPEPSQPPEPEEDYNPFEHREVKKPTSDFGALAHLVKSSLGTGTLAVPMAFKHAGLIGGTIGTAIIVFICIHCAVLLVRSAQVLCKKVRVPTLTYPGTAEAAFITGPKPIRRLSKFMKHLVTGELLFSFFMGNSVYVVFISSSIREVVEHYFHPSLHIRIYILSIWLPLILICQFRNLKSLVPCSVLANIFIFITYVIVFYYIFKDIHSAQSVKMFTSIFELPLFLCTVIFAVEGIGTVLPIENEMKNPDHFLGLNLFAGRIGIIYIAMSILMVLYLVMGFFGYLQYGDNTKGSITLNLPANETPAMVVKISVATAVFLTYALQYYVPITIVWEIIKGRIPKEQHVIWSTLMRAVLVSLTICIALAIPNLEPIIEIVGAIVFSTLGLLFPALFDTVVRWPHMGSYNWRLIKNGFIISVSLLTLTYGTYSSVKNIIETEYK